MKNKYNIIFYASNVTGLGSTNVVSNLLISLSNNIALNNYRVLVYLPNNNFWVNNSKFRPEWEINYLGYSKFKILRLLGRAFDVLFKGYFLPKCDLLIVLGDFALRTQSKQVLLLHNSHILKSTSKLDEFFFHRIVFNFNHKFVSKCIVQSNVIKSKLIKHYKHFTNDNSTSKFMPVSNIYSIKSDSKFIGRVNQLILFYPASFYPHKNHKLISQFIESDLASLHKRVKFRLTITNSEFDSLLSGGSRYDSFVQLLGTLSQENIYTEYLNSLALIFPSIEETYGLPLVEAMKMGKFILCADLPYSRELCGSAAIYFDPFSLESLSQALFILEDRVVNNDFPDWSESLNKIPNSWDDYSNWFLKNVLE